MRRFEQAGYKLIETDDGHWLTIHATGKNQGEPRLVMTRGVLHRGVHRHLFEVAYSVKLRKSTRLSRECTHAGCVNPAHWRYSTLTPQDIAEIKERIQKKESLVGIARDMSIARATVDRIWYAMRDADKKPDEPAERKNKAPWRSVKNPFYVMSKKLMHRKDRLLRQAVRIDDEIAARVARKERSSIADLEREKKDLFNEMGNVLQNAKRFQWKARMWQQLKAEAEELKGMKMPKEDDNE